MSKESAVLSIRLKRFAIGLATPLALLCAPPAALAQSQPKADPRLSAKENAPATAVAGLQARPAMWVVKDKDTTIYLFGTVHLMRPGIHWLDGPRKAAFDSAQELVLEIADDADTATQVRIAQRGINPTGPTLTSKLPEDVRPQLNKILADYQVPLAAVDRMKPWLAAVTLTALPLTRLGYDPENGVEVQLRKAARAQNKTVHGLETADEQIGFFDSLSEPVQLSMLVETIKEQPTIEQSLSKMIDAWTAGNPQVLADELNKSMEEDKEMQQRLLFDRNNRWADWIKARLDKPGTVFLAVGAGHLAGKGSVQEALKARRVKTKLVTKH